MSETKLKHKKIKAFSVSKFIFTMPALIFIVIIAFSIKTSVDISTFLVFFMAGSMFLLPYLIQYYSNSIVLTTKQIIVKNKFLKVSTKLNLIYDLKFFRYNQSVLGVVLNYATIELVDINNKIYKIDYIENPKEFEEKVMQQTEIYFKSEGVDISMQDLQEAELVTENTQEKSDDEQK